MEINQRLTFLDAYLMARAWRNVETLIPAGCTRREICVYVSVCICMCVCVCVCAPSPFHQTVARFGMEGSKRGGPWHHSNASSHVHVYRTDFVRNETATFIVIIWLRVARNCSVESRSPVQIPANFLQRKEFILFVWLIGGSIDLRFHRKEEKIFRKWKIILFEIELISAYWMLSGERDFFFKELD